MMRCHINNTNYTFFIDFVSLYLIAESLQHTSRACFNIARGSNHHTHTIQIV